MTIEYEVVMIASLDINILVMLSLTLLINKPCSLLANPGWTQQIASMSVVS
jgi:hypothetical protein